MAAWIDEGAIEVEKDADVHRWWRGGVKEEGGMDRWGCWGDRAISWCRYMEAWTVGGTERWRKMVAWIDGGAGEMEEDGGLDRWGTRGCGRWWRE